MAVPLMLLAEEWLVLALVSKLSLGRIILESCCVNSLGIELLLRQSYLPRDAVSWNGSTLPGVALFKSRRL
jgi:hypothetical protein